MSVLVDSNVLLDVSTRDPRWYEWSARTLAELGALEELAINPIIYAEVTVGYQSQERADEFLDPSTFRRLPLPWEAGFRAGKAFVAYRRSGGARRSPLPDFYIGAHAEVSGLKLVTRDTSRYNSYFPALELIHP
jgi:predicted nucleic acid-binding protein